MDFENELWKEIEGYGGRYQVSNCGRIWNVATQSMMKPQMKKTGYYSINLMKPNKKIVTERVHRLVALYFCKKHEECNVVNHIDSDKTNNRASNLEWTTIRTNNQMAMECHSRICRQECRDRHHSLAMECRDRTCSRDTACHSSQPVGISRQRKRKPD